MVAAWVDATAISEGPCAQPVANLLMGPVFVSVGHGPLGFHDAIGGVKGSISQQAQARAASSPETHSGLAANCQSGDSVKVLGR